MGHHFIYVPPTEPLTVNADVTRLAPGIYQSAEQCRQVHAATAAISTSASSVRGRTWWCIRDTGIGIAAEALPHIFDMFTQVKGASELAQGGLGIGLSLVKRLVELHGGQVRAHSGGVGAGAEFAVRLPLCDAAREGKPAS